MTNRVEWGAVCLLLIAILAIGGLTAAGAAVLASMALGFVCMGISNSLLADRIWLRLTVLAWIIVALWALQPAPTGCGPDDPASCSIR